MEDKFFLLGIIMKVNIMKVKWKDLENISGQMVAHLLVNGNRIKEMD